MLAATLAAAGTGHADDIYQEPEAFLEGAFGGDPPEPRVVWIDDGLRRQLEAVLGVAPKMLRVRYWRRGDRTAWILERIGKHQPITTGVIIDSRAVEKIKVLVYRESRGWEVRHEFFTEQFEGATLNDRRDKLDRQIDGISGATLSVRALTDIAEMALVLNDAVVRGDD